MFESDIPVSIGRPLDLQTLGLYAFKFSLLTVEHEHKDAYRRPH